MTPTHTLTPANPAPLALVTGATGFVGSAVARALLARGFAVRVLVRPQADRRNIADLPVEVVTGSLQEPATLEAAVAGCQAVFHVAADYRLWVPDPLAMMAANVDGTVNLLRAAQRAGVGRIVYTSSVAVLGFNPDGRPADETTPSSLSTMIGPYKVSKYKAEQAVMALGRDEGIPVVTVNPSMPIGPRDIKPTPTGRIITEAAKGRMPAYINTGLNVVHVDDVAEGHCLAYERGVIGERYILAGDNLTLADILSRLAVLSGRKPPTVQLPRLPLFPLAYAAEAWARVSGREPLLTVDSLKMAAHRMWFSSAKAEAALGYTHRPAQVALADALAWFKAEGYC